MVRCGSRCIFERRLSSPIKDRDCYLELANLGDDETDWGRIVRACKAGRQSPMAPDEFERMLTEGVQAEERQAGSGIKFTSGKDLTDVVIPQYEAGFLRLMMGATLDYSNLGWGAEAAEKLASALQYAASKGASPSSLECAKIAAPHIPHLSHT